MKKAINILLGIVLGCASFFICDRIIRFIFNLLYSFKITNFILSIPILFDFLTVNLIYYLPASIGTMVSFKFDKIATYIYAVLVMGLYVFAAISYSSSYGFDISLINYGIFQFLGIFLTIKSYKRLP